MNSNEAAVISNGGGLNKPPPDKHCTNELPCAALALAVAQ